MTTQEPQNGGVVVRLPIQERNQTRNAFWRELKLWRAAKGWRKQDHEGNLLPMFRCDYDGEGVA